MLFAKVCLPSLSTVPLVVAVTICRPSCCLSRSTLSVSFGLLAVGVLRLPGDFMFGFPAVAGLLAIPACPFSFFETAVSGVLGNAVAPQETCPTILRTTALTEPLAALGFLDGTGLVAIPTLWLFKTAVSGVVATTMLLTAALVELLARPGFSSIVPYTFPDAATGSPTFVVFELPALALSRFLPSVGFWQRAVTFHHSRFLAKARSVALSPINGERPTQPGSPSPRVSWSYSWSLNRLDTSQRLNASSIVPPSARQLAQIPW